LEKVNLNWFMPAGKAGVDEAVYVMVVPELGRLFVMLWIVVHEVPLEEPSTSKAEPALVVRPFIQKESELTVPVKTGVMTLSPVASIISAGEL